MNSLFRDLLCLLLEFRFVYFCFSVLFSDLFTSRIPLSLLELLTQFAGFPTVCFDIFTPTAATSPRPVFTSA